MWRAPRLTVVAVNHLKRYDYAKTSEAATLGRVHHQRPTLRSNFWDTGLLWLASWMEVHHRVLAGLDFRSWGQSAGSLLFPVASRSLLQLGLLLVLRSVSGCRKHFHSGHRWFHSAVGCRTFSKSRLLCHDRWPYIQVWSEGQKELCWSPNCLPWAGNRR